MKKIYLLVACGVFALVLALVMAIRQHYIIPNTETMSLFEITESLRTLFKNPQGAQTIKVVYFWQDHCPCDSTVSPHFFLMKNTYLQQAATKIEFFIAPVGNSDAHFTEKSLHHRKSLDGVKILPADLLAQVAPSIHFTPSVAIWNEQGELSYYGPHSLGYLCTDDTSFVKKVVDRLLAGKGFSPLDVLGEGCFCSVN